MSGVNKAIILGHLGRDPELRYTASGTAVCNLSVATSRAWRSKESGERQEETEWHRCVAYDRIAETLGEHMEKGKPVYLEGRLKTRKWTDKGGADHYTTEIIVESFQFVGGRGDDADRPTQEQRENRAAARERTRPAPTKSQTGFDDMDDDIPF